MPTVSIEEAQVKLADLIAQLHSGGPVVITQDNRPVAKLTSETAYPPKARKAGTAKGLLEINQEDDHHLEDFKEYLE